MTTEVSCNTTLAEVEQMFNAAKAALDDAEGRVRDLMAEDAYSAMPSAQLAVSDLEQKVRSLSWQLNQLRCP